MPLGRRTVVVECREPSDSDCHASQIACSAEVLRFFLKNVFTKLMQTPVVLSYHHVPSCQPY